MGAFGQSLSDAPPAVRTRQTQIVANSGHTFSLDVISDEASITGDEAQTTHWL